MNTLIDYNNGNENSDSINALWHYVNSLNKEGYSLKISCYGVIEESPGDDEKSDEINKAIDILLNRAKNENLCSIIITNKWVLQHFSEPVNGYLMEIWSPFSLC